MFIESLGNNYTSLIPVVALVFGVPNENAEDVVVTAGVAKVSVGAVDLLLKKLPPNGVAVADDILTQFLQHEITVLTVLSFKNVYFNVTNIVFASHHINSHRCVASTGSGWFISVFVPIRTFPLNYNSPLDVPG